jgi:nucleoside-diphosphate-sugar epimerase
MNAIVFGAGGFIGNALSERLAESGYNVIGVDKKIPAYNKTKCNTFMVLDLVCSDNVEQVFKLYPNIDEVYQLAADMGGAGYIFSKKNDHKIVIDNNRINSNIVDACRKYCPKKVFYSSSACIYPEYNQMDENHPVCSEISAYPACPDSEYGWEKLFAEHMFDMLRRYDIQVRIARFHNIYGPRGAWNNGREKSPAAMCRKVSEAIHNKSMTVEVWGDGEQTRSYLYIDDCLDAIRLLMDNDCQGIYNIGSEEMVSINRLVKMVSDIAGADTKITHVDGFTGVRGRCSDNSLIHSTIGWLPKLSLMDGLEKLYPWIDNLVKSGEKDADY